jgi:exodeoxyribonuclease V beta subunit
MTAHYPRPAILDEIPLNRHALIEASAGTGKTYAIEHMVIELLLRARVALGEILVLTFTERAATELRQRIRSKIEEILAFLDEGETHRGEPAPRGWLIDATARQRLNRALFSFDAASIGTIHGFFGQVLTEHAFTNGRLLAGTLEDGRALFGLAFKSALRRVLARQPSAAADLLSLWLEPGRQGIEKLEGFLWTCHSSHRHILPPFSIEAIDHELESNPLFEIDLAGALDRFKVALKDAKIHASTANAMVRRLNTLAQLIQASGRSWGTVLNDGFQDAVRFIGTGLNKCELADERAQQIASAILRLDKALVSLEAAIVQTGLPIVREVLAQHKAVSGAFDHDDQIQGVVRVLDGLRGNELIRAMRARYHFALIDEFQDTDELQWSFFQRVFVESAGRNVIYLIGDPKQAIYGFRGADVHTYLRAREQVKQAGTPVVPMSRNFRSTRDLVDAYNHILDPTADPPFLAGTICYDRPVEVGRELIAEQAGGATSAPIHLLKIEPRDGDSLSISALKRSLARRIAHEIRELLSEKEGLRFGPKGESRRIEAGDIYVLAALNKEAREVSRALREAEVPFAFYKQEGLFQTDEARQVHDLLAAIVDPANADKRSRAWITPFFAVPLAALPDLGELSDSHPLIKRLQDWNELAGKRRFAALFARIIDESGIIRRELFVKDDERALTNYLHIFEILLEDSHAAGRDLVDLVATLTAYIRQTRQPPGDDGNVQRLESDRAAVQIMTIHKSKGLEAAVVFLYGGFSRFRASGIHEYHDAYKRMLYIGENEEAKKKADENRSQEEQRLYYVALTRAKARLYLPLVPAKLSGRKWDGGYRQLNERLHAVASTIERSPQEHLFNIVSGSDCPLKTGRIDPARAGGALASWRPKKTLFADRSNRPDFSEYRRKHAGYIVSSYSRMKRAWTGDLDPLERDAFRREPGQKTLAALLKDDDLPGGTATGTMLHEVLEKIPFNSLAGNPSLDDWLAAEPVEGLFDQSMARNGITATAAQRRQSGHMIHRALTMTIPVGQERFIPGLHHCRNVVPEMEFLFPFPEDTHPPLSNSRPGKLMINNGFIKGFVDLVVEHGNRVYFADWKSDVLPSYEPDMIAKHVDEHYGIQVKLYSLALVKALRIGSASTYETLVGGLFYVFLRALNRDDGEAQGVYFKRLEWADILQYEAELKRSDPRSDGVRA